MNLPIVTTRALTEAEILRLQDFYGPQEKKVELLKVNWLPFQLGASGILFLLLAWVSYFAEHKTLSQSITFGLMGPIMVFGVSFWNWLMSLPERRQVDKQKQDYKKDIEERIVRVEEWHLKRAFFLNDEGEPFDLLIVQTTDGRWMALLCCDVIESLGTVVVKSKLHIFKFPRTADVVMIHIDGEALAIPKEPIISNNFWRHDGASCYEPMKTSEFPTEIAQQLNRYK